MTLEDKICEILRGQYHCRCDKTGSPQSIIVGVPNTAWLKEILKPPGVDQLDFCPAIKQIIRATWDDEVLSESSKGGDKHEQT